MWALQLRLGFPELPKFCTAEGPHGAAARAPLSQYSVLTISPWYESLTQCFAPLLILGLWMKSLPIHSFVRTINFSVVLENIFKEVKDSIVLHGKKRCVAAVIVYRSFDSQGKGRCGRTMFLVRACFNYGKDKSWLGVGVEHHRDDNKWPSSAQHGYVWGLVWPVLLIFTSFQMGLP